MSQQPPGPLIYEWDANDNLTARRDYQQSPPVYETFTYDALDRIDSSMRNGTPNLDVNYDATGNVTSKSDVGSYTYDATKIHAVTSAGANTYTYDANGNVISRNGSYLGWTSYDRPSRIDNGAGTVSYLWYDAERRLWRQEAHTSGVPETTVYVGELLEKVTKDGTTSWKHYVEAPTGTAAVYLRRSDGTGSTYYLTHDHLGSTDKVLDAAGGIVTVAESFTALGARRGANWQGTPTPAELAAIASTTRDGFTGHVMLDNVGLVHMQGRVYDPAIGRFLSVDPVVRDVAAAQSWNGYGYVEGRVLSATDPRGMQAKPVFSNGNTQHRGDPPRSAWVTSVSYGPTWTLDTSNGVENWELDLHLGEHFAIDQLLRDNPSGLGGRADGAWSTVSVGPIESSSDQCEVAVMSVVELGSYVAEPVVDLNIAIWATRAERLARVATRGFGGLGASLALRDINDGIRDGDTSEILFGSADLVASAASTIPQLAPLTTVYFSARFVWAMRPPEQDGSSCGD